MSAPEVCVVVPFFNSSSTLIRAVRSALFQEEVSVSVIAVNDGSTDDGPDKITRLADKRIELVTLERGGPSRARNVGAARTEAEYVMFVDSDDRLLPGSLAELLAVSRANGDASVFGGYRLTSPGRESVDMPMPYQGPALSGSEVSDVIESLVAGRLMGTACRALYRTDVIRRHSVAFPEELRFAEDLVFNLYYLRHIEKLAIHKGIVYEYLLRDGSLTVGHVQDYPRQAERLCSILEVYALELGLQDAFDGRRAKSARFGLSNAANGKSRRERSLEFGDLAGRDFMRTWARQPAATLDDRVRQAAVRTQLPAVIGAVEAMRAAAWRRAARGERCG